MGPKATQTAHTPRSGDSGDKAGAHDFCVRAVGQWTVGGPIGFTYLQCQPGLLVLGARRPLSPRSLLHPPMPCMPCNFITAQNARKLLQDRERVLIGSHAIGRGQYHCQTGHLHDRDAAGGCVWDPQLEAGVTTIPTGDPESRKYVNVMLGTNPVGYVVYVF